MQPPAKRPPPAAEVTIERIGADGDGVAHLPDGAPVYVPCTLPDEVVTAEPTRSRGDGWMARPLHIARPSEARVDPPCGYFGRCGGCVLQHWREADYAGWKRGLLAFALRRAGYTDAPDIPLIRGLPGERRRLDFAVRRDRRGIIIGLHATGSAEVVDLTDCLVLHPTLMALIEPLRSVLSGLGTIRKEASVVINLVSNGPDILLRADAPLSLSDRTALIEFARTHGGPRLSWTQGNGVPEPVCLFRPPAAIMSGAEVRPPPGVFLQATAEGEAAIIAAVLAGLPAKLTPRTRIAELYAGCGTLTFALAPHVRITAFEGDAASVSALRDGVNRASLGGRIEVTQRDLARQPLSAKDLSGYAAVVLDPPHAGAAAQIAQVAASSVPTVIYVSCNPATLSRDAKMLRDSGYTLAAATAIDQFLWSARLESVCVFRRP